MNEALARTELVETMKFFHSRSWTPGTGGNFSIVLSVDPLALLMSPSGVDKGRVTQDELIVVSGNATVLSGSGKASAETLIHTAIASAVGAGSILHVHSVFNTLISRHYAKQKGFSISGLEMLKSLEGNQTHETEEWIPIVANSQNMPALAREIERVLFEHPTCKGILLEGHGLYTWGRDVYSARRHVEGLEFLFEVCWREYLSSR